MDRADQLSRSFGLLDSTFEKLLHMCAMKKSDVSFSYNSIFACHILESMHQSHGSGGSRISQRGGRQPLENANLLFDQFFPKTA